jgi:D-alanyl-lipoteichoic acid acyltransferase DltB (MBOAT superfamily)
VGKWKAVRNTFAIFLVSGFWHGANWTFVIWGLIHALLFLPLLLLNRNRRNTGDITNRDWIPSLNELIGMAWTFSMVTMAWIFFRVEHLNQAFEFISNFGENSFAPTKVSSRASAFWVFLMLGIEWFAGVPEFWRLWRISVKWMIALRWTIYALSVWLIMKNLQSQAEFIYFQF